MRTGKSPLLQESLKELRQKLRWRCKHGHDGISHYNCWVEENTVKERVGFIDIEFWNLDANFGVMLCWCIKVNGEELILSDKVNLDDLRNKDIQDKNLVQSCIDTMSTFHHLVGHYSGKCDIPYIRTRAMKWGLEFPHYGEIVHTDVWRMAKVAMKLNSNRQDTIAGFLRGKSLKTAIDDSWIKAVMCGDQKALDNILDHCERDVLDLEANYLALKPYCRRSVGSI